MLRSLSLAAAALALAPLAAGQTVLYQTSFDDQTGWTNAGYCWSVDATPAGFLPGPYRSAPSSLNCNSPAGFAEVCTYTTIDGPAIDLSSAGVFGATLSFWCAYELEENFCDIEARHVQISNDGFQTLLVDQCYLWQDCGPNPSPWHQHQIPLSSAWGTIQVRFMFDCYDFLWGGSYDGWFIDDLVVVSECPPSVPYCIPKVNSAGCMPGIHTTGVPSYSGAGAAFRIHASSVLNGHPGILIWSLASASTPFGGGTLCLASPVKRTPGQASGGNPYPPGDCSGSFSFNFTSALMQSNGLVPGTAVFTQFWSRDTGYTAPDNVGLTSGIRFAVCD